MSEVTVSLLADHPNLIKSIGLMRWSEWGHTPEPEVPDWWIAATARESGRDSMPITFVALDEEGAALGAVGLAEHDLEERCDRSPWVIGTIVRADRRSEGVGRALLTGLEEFATRAGFTRLWVATERAACFYEACGFQVVERLGQPERPSTDVLTKKLKA